MLGLAITVALAVLLAVIAAIHVYWACGGYWPGTDEPSLAQMVVGGQNHMPPNWMSLFVAGAFCLFAVAPLAYANLIQFPIFGYWLRGTLWILTSIFLTRGIGGFFESQIRTSIAGTPYESLSKRFYSPLCIAIGSAFAFLAA